MLSEDWEVLGFCPTDPGIVAVRAVRAFVRDEEVYYSDVSWESLFSGVPPQDLGTSHVG